MASGAAVFKSSGNETWDKLRGPKSIQKIVCEVFGLQISLPLSNFPQFFVVNLKMTPVKYSAVSIP